MRRGSRFDMGAGRYSAYPTSSPPTELFPDPTLADTGNASLYQFNGTPAIAPANLGAGPDILVANADANNDDGFELIGGYNTAFLASVAASSTKTVQITVGSFVSSGSVQIAMRLGTLVEFAVSGNGSVSHSVAAGTDEETGFRLFGPVDADGGVFTITGISVT